MKTAVVIFTRNAASRTDWKSVLKSYSDQDICACRILVDSESIDTTVEEAKKYGWDIRIEKVSDFNHGLTRSKIALDLFENGFDTAVFATQDVILADKNSLKILTESLIETGSAAAYARQIPLNEKDMDGCFRRINYPETSMLKSKDNIAELGLMTPFCSNSLAAWDLRKTAAVGGFPETDFGEDMLLGAKIIMAGEKIFYCADSKCFHQHSNTFRELFSRGLAIGRMHGEYPELKRVFGKIESWAAQRIQLKIKLRFFMPLAVKYLGYLLGKAFVKPKKL